MSETSALLKRPRGAPAPAHHVRTRAACGQDEGAVRAPGAGLAPRPRAGPASGHPPLPDAAREPKVSTGPLPCHATSTLRTEAPGQARVRGTVAPQKLHSG